MEAAEMTDMADSAENMTLRLERWKSTGQTALRLRVGSQWVRDLIKRGKLVAVRSEAGLLISVDSIERFERERASK